MSDQGEMELGNVTLADALAAGLDPPREKWAGTLADLVDRFAAHYERGGREVDDALAEARTVVVLLADYVGGRALYLPRGASLQTALRDRMIYHQARRGNTQELAARYGIVERRVQQIVAEQHAIQISKRQGKLFGT